MATAKEKAALGLLLLSLLGAFSFIGYKYYTIDGQKIPFKSFQDSNKYLELGIENGTEQCATCDRIFYLKMLKKVGGNTSLTIPKDSITIELFDGKTGQKLNLPFELQYRSGTSWKKAPTALALSTSIKYFRIVANVSEGSSVSGMIGVRFKIGDQVVEIKEDPLWWINEREEDLEYVQECRVVKESYSYERAIPKQCNEQILTVDNITKGTYIDYRNITCDDRMETIIVPAVQECKDIGIISNGKKILYAENGYTECIGLCCVKEGQGDKNGKIESGEGADCFTSDLKIESTSVSKTSSIEAVKVK